MKKEVITTVAIFALYGAAIVGAVEYNHTHPRMCPRGWWVDMDEPVMVPCKTLHPQGDE